MPQVRKLSDEEVRGIERTTLGQRKATEVEYDRYMADFSAGDYGEVDLTEGEKRLTVRNRLKAAAARHTPPLALTFARTRSETLRFQVAAAGEEVANDRAMVVPVEEPQAPEPAPRKPGRPRGRKAEASTPAEETPKRRRGRKTAAEG